MKILLCCEVRNENRYIRDFVEYYRSLGFDNILVYDNGCRNEDYAESVLRDFIREGYVIIDNSFRDKAQCQTEAYNDCYEKYKGKYDWIAFFDVDEYLTLNEKYKDAKDYLSESFLEPFGCIHLFWECYGDNGLEDYTPQPVYERFTTPLPEIEIVDGATLNCHVKSIIRTTSNIDRSKYDGWVSSHMAYIDGDCCNDCGELIQNRPIYFPKFISRKNAYLRHYITKTISEFCKSKIYDNDGNWTHKTKYPNAFYHMFFDDNEVTPNKIAIYNKAMEHYTLDKCSNKIKRVDAQIFVLTHKKANVKDNLLYTPVLGGASASHIFDYDLRDDIGNNISDFNSLYCENTSTYWIATNMTDPRLKYIGQCAYRRMFDLDEYTDFDTYFKDYDVILPKAIDLHKTTIENYKEWHSLGDLEDMLALIEEFYPDYKDDIEKFKQQTTLYNGNGFIMKKEDYIAYCNFFFPLANEWLKRHNIGSLSDVNAYVSEKFRNGEYEKFDIEEQAIYYQKRIIGFLSERVLNVFILHNFKNIFISPVVLSETDY